MRQFLTLLFLSLLCFSSCKRKQADILADIRKNYTEINNNLKDYTRKQVDDITSAINGSITGYYRDDEIKKINSEHYSDTCRTFSEYYFDDGMLIFIIRQNYVYNKPRTYTEEKAKANNDSVWYDDKKTRLEISRFYFDKNKLIKWLNPDNIDIPVNTAEFINMQSALWAETVILIKQLKEQTPNP